MKTTWSSSSSSLSPSVMAVIGAAKWRLEEQGGVRERGRMEEEERKWEEEEEEVRRR